MIINIWIFLFVSYIYIFFSFGNQLPFTLLFRNCYDGVYFKPPPAVLLYHLSILEMCLILGTFGEYISRNSTETPTLNWSPFENFQMNFFNCKVSKSLKKSSLPRKLIIENYYISKKKFFNENKKSFFGLKRKNKKSFPL